MKWSAVLLLFVAGIAVFWYARRGNTRPGIQQGGGDAYRLQASAGNQNRPSVPSPAPPASRSSQGGILQEAADTATGKRYEEATDQLEAATAELAAARQEAERAAARLAGRADEALATVQAAAEMKSRSVPGDGTRDCPSDYPVKGNQSSMLYHMPGSATYGSTIPEFCFADAAAAEEAGFSPTRR